MQKYQKQEIRPTVKDVVLSWPARSVGVLTGDSRVFHLAHSWMIRHFLANKRVRIIDCAIRFNSNYLVDELLRLDEPVDAALMSIDIRRAFTPYQILDAVHEIALHGNKEGEVFYILAPFKQFFDGDVATDESAYLLHMLNEKLARLSRLGWPVVVVEHADYQHASFQQAYQQLTGIAKPLWQIVNIRQPTGTGSVLRTSITGETHGTNDRAIQHSNGNGGATLQQIPPSFAKGRPKICR